MKFNLKRPCSHCPFRNDRKQYLRPGRVLELQSTIETEGRTFSCHETVDYGRDDTEHGDDYIPGKKDHHCAGALILLELAFDGPGGGPGCGVNQMARIAMRLGMFNPNNLDLTAPAHESFEAMYDAAVDAEGGT